MSTTTDAACPAARALPNEPPIWAVDDMRWTTVGPLLVIDKPRKKSGRPRHDDRRILTGLIWLARTGSPWSQLPRQFGPTSTVHARFQEWVAYGVFARAWAQVVAAYDPQVGLTWEWQAADGCLIKAPGGKKGLPLRRKPRGPTRLTAPHAAPSATC